MPLTSPNDKLFIKSNSTSCSGSLVRSAIACIPIAGQFPRCTSTPFMVPVLAEDGCINHARMHTLRQQNARTDTAVEQMHHARLSPTGAQSHGYTHIHAHARARAHTHTEKATVRQSAGMSRSCSRRAKMRIFSRSRCALPTSAGCWLMAAALSADTFSNAAMSPWLNACSIVTSHSPGVPLRVRCKSALCAMPAR
jgi:hypothetical protein